MPKPDAHKLATAVPSKTSVAVKNQRCRKNGADLSVWVRS